MSVEGYFKGTGRYMDGSNPYILLCPQCNDTLECTSNKNKCYCFGCGITLDRSEVKEMCQFGYEEAIEFKEDE